MYFDEANFMIGILGNVHGKSFAIGFSNDLQKNLRRWFDE